MENIRSENNLNNINDLLGSVDVQIPNLPDFSPSIERRPPRLIDRSTETAEPKQAFNAMQSPEIIRSLRTDDDNVRIFKRSEELHEQELTTLRSIADTLKNLLNLTERKSEPVDAVPDNSNLINRLIPAFRGE